MDGLEVTPRSPSSSMSCFSSPDEIIPRRMKSIKMLCPKFSSFSKGFSFILIPPASFLLRVRQPPFEILDCERTGLGNQLAGGLNLLPHIPQQHASHATVLQVVDDAFFVGSLPVGKSLQVCVHFADGLVSQIEHIGVKERQMMVGLRSARHVPARHPSHGIGV